MSRPQLGGGGGSVVLLVAASLLWKEAAYASPLVFAAACLCARPAPTGAWRRRWLLFGVLLLLVGWHYLSRSTRTATAGGAEAVATALLHHVACFLRGMLPLLPANDFLAVGATIVVAVPLFWLASPLARFFLLWSAAAMLPYVVMSHGERFSYFFHVPAVLFVARLSSDLVGRWRWARGTLVFGVLWLAVAAAAAVHLPAALDVHRRQGEQCRRVLEFLADNDLMSEPELVVDAMPLYLENGLPALMELFGGHRPRIVYLQVVSRPPFLLYLEPDFGRMPATTRVLQFGTGDVLRTTDKATLVGDAVPLPILSLAGDYELVADEAAARRALGRPGCDPVARPLLFEPPPCTIEPPGEHRIDDLAVDLRETTFVTECARPTLLTVAFPIGVDLERNGRILVDGAPVAVLRANLLFHAICLPPGRHRVTLRPALRGG